MNKEHTTETNAKSPIPKKKSQGRKWKAGIGLLMAAFLLQILARRLSGFGQWYAVTVYPILVRDVWPVPFFRGGAWPVRLPCGNRPPGDFPHTKGVKMWAGRGA